MKKLSILLSILFLFLLPACSDNKDSTTWIVGTSADNPPYEFMQNGEIVGFDIDFINEIGKFLGKKLEFRNMEFHSLLAALSTSNVDLVIAGLSTTPERLTRVEFSIPYISSEIGILYRKEDNFANYKDLKGKKVGAQLGTTWNLIANELAKDNEFTITSLSGNLMLVEELKSRRIDALVLEAAQARKFIEIYPDLARFTDKNLSSSFAIAMPKNSPHKQDIDRAIKALQSKGITQALAKKWGLTGAK